MRDIKEIIKEAGYYYIVSINPPRNTFYRVFVVDKKEGVLIPVRVETPYWNRKKGVYHCTAIGSERGWEIIYSINNELFRNPYEITSYTYLN